MEFNLKLDSDEKYDGIGDKFSIKDFIEYCEDHSFIDYDGFASEIVLNDKVVFSFMKDAEDFLYPSDALEHKEKLLKLDAEENGLEIVWCNR